MTEPVELPADLDSLDTAELLDLLGTVGPVVVERKAELAEARAAMVRLLVVLDGRQVSYRRLAVKATGISGTGVLKALQRAGVRQAPPIV